MINFFAAWKVEVFSGPINFVHVKKSIVETSQITDRYQTNTEFEIEVPTNSRINATTG